MNYDTLANKATQLITSFGRELTFTRITNGSYDPATGKTANTEATYNKFACVFDYTEQDRVDGVILQGDKRLLAEPYAYEVGDRVSVDGKSYEVLSVKLSMPADVILSVTMQIRA